MENVAAVVEQVTEGLEPSVSAACASVIEALGAIPAEELRRITVMWLASSARLRWDDATMQSALAALTSVRCHPLDMYFIMYDELTRRELTFEVDEVSQSLSEGELIHPHTGEPIPDFTRQLKPVYRLTPQFARMLNANG